MSNSPLVNYTRISPNRNSPRNHKIDTITIHCAVGHISVEGLGSTFAPSDGASSNYGIGWDGRVGMYVEEKDRSWCSSNRDNDHRAITIECACDPTHPYAINDAVYNTLIKLCVDICKRNDIKELKWKADKSLIGNVDKQNMTVHRWFENKSCPGDYIYSRLGKIAADVNAKLGSTTVTPKPPVDSKYPAAPFTVKVLIDDLNYRAKPSMDGAVNGQTGKGLFTIVDVSGEWGKLKSGGGWIYLANESYCTIQKTTTVDTSFKVRVDIPDLNIRKGPGTNYDTTGEFTGASVFTILEVQSGPGSDSGWGRLKSGAGWISLDYTKRV